MSGWIPVIAVLAAVALSILTLMWVVFCLAGMANLEIKPIHRWITLGPLFLTFAAWLVAVALTVRWLKA